MSNILTINTGSGTIKLALFSVENNELQETYRVTADKLNKPYQLRIVPVNADVIQLNFPDNTADNNFYSAAIALLIAWLNEKNINITAVSHRVVHGGIFFMSPLLSIMM